mmetsp:Transcript_27806/g.54651  ORF Transcript_27806/g.54651 Transcript_27806/m.54651 type:complete len:80 (-) Transcript_27806:554-793(-)
MVRPTRKIRCCLLVEVKPLQTKAWAQERILVALLQALEFQSVAAMRVDESDLQPCIGGRKPSHHFEPTSPGSPWAPSCS